MLTGPVTWRTSTSPEPAIRASSLSATPPNATSPEPAIEAVVDNVDDLVIEELDGGADLVFTTVSWAATSDIEILSTRVHSSTDPIDLTGNPLAQTLYGNNGANVLDGGAGNDTLFGLGGSDTFRFTTQPGAGNIDMLGDFVSGTDTIRLGGEVFVGLGPGSLESGAFTAGTSATSPGHRIIYDPATGALFFDADGDAPGAAVQFALLAPWTALTGADFAII